MTGLAGAGTDEVTSSVCDTQFTSQVWTGSLLCMCGR